MKYNYQLTKEDWKKVRFIMDDAYNAIERKKKFCKIFLIVYGLACTLYFLFYKQYVIACIFIILLLIIYGLFRCACRKRFHDKFTSMLNVLCLKRHPYLIKPQITSIENDVIINTRANGKVYKKSINDIKRIIVSDEFIIIVVVGLGCITAIPSRVFNSEDERELLIKTLNKNNKMKKL